jgi:hypothetical protein
MHEDAYHFIARTVLQLRPRRSVIELGSRVIRGAWPCSGSVRPLFPGACYVGLDTAPGEGVDVVGDLTSWWPSSSSQPAMFDTVVCAELLEHTPQAERVCRHAWELLEPGGVLILTAAGVGRLSHSVDGGPLRPGEFYRNVTVGALRGWLSPFIFCMVDTFSNPGDIHAIAVRAAEPA